MLFACFLALLPWLSAVSAVDSSCSDLGEDNEETCALQTQSSRKSGFKLGDFDKSLPSGYFDPISVGSATRYKGKKVFFSKNSCATVLYCLKAVYGKSDSTAAWGRQKPSTEDKPTTLKGVVCKLIPQSKLCVGYVRRPGRLVKPGEPGAILGPEAHNLCKQANFFSEVEGCSQWQIPFMNQLALTLGSSSEGYNLFLDFGSSGIAHCFPPAVPDYDQGCVNETLKTSVKQADIFLFFPDWYCGPSCKVEVEIAKEVEAAGHPIKLIELDWDDYYEVFKSFDTPPNPSLDPSEYVAHLTEDQTVTQWRAGSKAGVYILDAIQSALSTGAAFIPDGECAIREGACASGKTYTNEAGLGCEFKSFGGLIGKAGACDACKDAVTSLYSVATTGALGACAKFALESAPICGATNAEDLEIGFAPCEALVVAACAALEDELKKNTDLTLTQANDVVCQTHLGVCPSSQFTRFFCGCLPAGQCLDIGEEYCCSQKSRYTFGKPCLRDFHQGTVALEMCI